MVSYVNAENIGQKVGVKASTIKKWARGGIIPCLRLTGRVLRFDPEAVEQALAQRAAKFQPQLERTPA